MKYRVYLKTVYIEPRIVIATDIDEVKKMINSFIEYGATVGIENECESWPDETLPITDEDIEICNDYEEPDDLTKLVGK